MRFHHENARSGRIPSMSGRSPQGPVNELSDWKAETALDLWREGRDTAQIADFLGCAEALVFNTIRARREEKLKRQEPRGWAGERRVAGVAHG